MNRLNTDAVGISPDKPEQQKKFAENHGLNFPLLSDADRQVADQFGVWGEKKLYGKNYMGIIRSSFLVDENGIVRNSWYNISPKDTVPEALKALA